MLVALSVDLDEIDCYTSIHGLAGPPAHATRAIYERAVPRFQRLFREEAVPATFFVIGRDLESSDENRAALAALHADGHELANHSHHHFYDLTRRDAETQRREVEGCARLLRETTGQARHGFRAPGYTITDGLVQVLSDCDVLYDSSVFPCPSYFGAKATAIAALGLRGRRSHSVLDDPRVLTAPADPYRMGRPYYRRGSGLLELPVGVTSDLSGRLPYIGTSIVLAGRRGTRLLSRLTQGRPLVNLEMHGIDLADADADNLQFLRGHQPDLRRSLADKEAALREAIATLRRRGARFVTLRDAAEELKHSV